MDPVRAPVFQRERQRLAETVYAIADSKVQQVLPEYVGGNRRDESGPVVDVDVDRRVRPGGVVRPTRYDGAIDDIQPSAIALCLRLGARQHQREE